MGFKTSECTADVWLHYYIFFQYRLFKTSPELTTFPRRISSLLYTRRSTSMEKVRNIRLAAPARRRCDVPLLNMAQSWTQFSNFCLSAGELTLEEFISGAREHPDIMEMLTKMMDLTHVLEIIVSGQQKKAINWAADTFWAGRRAGGGGEGFGHNGWRAGSRLTLSHQKLYCTWLRGPVHDWLLPQSKQRNRALLSAWAPTVLGTFNNASLGSGDRGGTISFQLEMDDQKQGLPWLYFNGSLYPENTVWDSGVTDLEKQWRFRLVFFLTSDFSNFKHFLALILLH